MRCATLTTLAQLSDESLFCSASRLHDCGVRNRANFRANALQFLFDFDATRMQNSAGARRKRCATCTRSVQISAESLFCLAWRLHDCGVRSHANFREKTRERAANFVRFRCNAHAKLGRRAPLAGLRNMRETSKTDPFSLGKITRHTFALHAARK